MVKELFLLIKNLLQPLFDNWLKAKNAWLLVGILIGIIIGGITVYITIEKFHGYNFGTFVERYDHPTFDRAFCIVDFYRDNKDNVISCPSKSQF